MRPLLTLFITEKFSTSTWPVTQLAVQRVCDALHVVAGVGAVNALFCGCDDCVVCPATSSRLVLTLAPMPHVAEKVTYKLTFEEISQLNERKDQLKKEHAKVQAHVAVVAWRWLDTSLFLQYLTEHPEIKNMLSDFMCATLLNWTPHPEPGLQCCRC
jgi:hypothetical protein